MVRATKSLEKAVGVSEMFTFSAIYMINNSIITPSITDPLGNAHRRTIGIAIGSACVFVQWKAISARATSTINAIKAVMALCARVAVRFVAEWRVSTAIAMRHASISAFIF